MKIYYTDKDGPTFIITLDGIEKYIKYCQVDENDDCEVSVDFNHGVQ